jgi:hypothetical protein
MIAASKWSAALASPSPKGISDATLSTYAKNSKNSTQQPTVLTLSQYIVYCIYEC